MKRSIVCMALAMGAGALVVPGVRADSPPPFPDFTFKMGKPPEPGATRRITVQIEPGEAVAARPRADAAGDATPAKPDAGTARYGWFWSQVDSDLGAEPVARLRAALQTLDNGPEGAKVAGPRLQALQAIAARDGADILRATIGTRVSPALVLAVIAVESGGRAGAESGKGARGLMQLMPDTAARFGVADPLEAADNIRGGVAYLDWLLGEFGGDAVLALAGYNAGEGAVRTHAGVPPYAETRDYIPKVLAAFRVARGLCQTPPQLVTDACALRLAAN